MSGVMITGKTVHVLVDDKPLVSLLGMNIPAAEAKGVERLEIWSSVRPLSWEGLRAEFVTAHAILTTESAHLATRIKEVKVLVDRQSEERQLKRKCK